MGRPSSPSPGARCRRQRRPETIPHRGFFHEVHELADHAAHVGAIRAGRGDTHASRSRGSGRARPAGLPRGCLEPCIQYVQPKVHMPLIQHRCVITERVSLRVAYVR